MPMEFDIHALRIQSHRIYRNKHTIILVVVFFSGVFPEHGIEQQNQSKIEILFGKSVNRMTSKFENTSIQS